VDVVVNGEAFVLVNEPEHLWTAAAHSLRAQVSEAVWFSTFSQAKVLTCEGNELVLAVPSSLVKERIEGRYEALVRDAFADLGHHDLQLRIRIAPDSPDAVPEMPASDAPALAALAPASETPLRREPGPTFSGLNPKYTFEAFVTGASNRFAHAAALAVAETPARSYNPLFIYGAAGLGKTHLLHAIAHYVHQNYAHYQVRYVTTEVALNEFVDAIRANAMSSFKRRYREIDVLMVDDIQFMEGKEQFQEEFFHTFNSLHAANKQIVISSDRQPDAIPTLEDRLRSRFKMGLITDIQPPELETRLAILRKKAERETTPVPPEVLEYIASNITSNIRELEGALTRVQAWGSLNKAMLTAALAERVLADSLSHQPRAITPTLILETTAKMYGFTVDELRSKSRRKPLVGARQTSMYVFRELTDLSYPAIAREFGGRDHTTVMYAVEKIENMMKERQQVYDQVTELIQRIKAGG